jgi:dihydroorotase
MEYARTKDLLIVEHAQDMSLSGKGVMHEGAVSARLGLPGVPSAAEEVAVTRDIAIAEMTGARLHLTHVSTKGAIASIREAKARGIRVTCDVTPHHLAMTDEWVGGSRAFAWEPPAGDTATPYDASTKVNPPLRGRQDVRALWEGIVDGTVDAIATDHAPHASVKKNVEFDQAAFGISGLETALSLVLGGVAAGWAERDTVIRALTTGPAGVLGIDAHDDDWIAIDPEAEWTVAAESLVSLGTNTPLLGKLLRGRVVYAVVDGEVRFEGGLRGATKVGSR